MTSFRKSTAAALAFTIVPRHVLGGQGYTAPSDQLTKGIIGVGGMGRGHLNMKERVCLLFAMSTKIISTRQLHRQAGKYAGYQDFRELIARPDIDIVHIATPPHWHGIMSKMAAEAGKDIWCEKPMTRTIGEGIKVVEAVQKHGRMFRLNTWFRFKDQFYGLGYNSKTT